jgi:hypothetical protein
MAWRRLRITRIPPTGSGNCKRFCLDILLFDRDCVHQVISEECVNMEFHLSRKPRHAPTSFAPYALSITSLNTGSATLAPVSSGPSERLSSKPIRTATVIPVGAICGPNEECVPVLVCGSCLPHNGDREPGRIKCMSRSSRHAHHTAQALLNQRERATIDIDRR